MEMKERESRRRGGEKTYITLVVLLFCSKIGRVGTKLLLRRITSIDLF